MTTIGTGQQAAPDIPRRLNATTLLDANLDAGRGDKVAIHWGDERVTYAELAGRAQAFGRAVRALGVGPGERVLLALDDSPAFPVAFLGAIRAGVVPVAVNPMLKPDDYRYFATDSGARLLVTDPALVDTVYLALQGEGAPRLVVSGGAAEHGGAAGHGALALDDLLAEHTGELTPADTARDDMAFWLYSSGSTGRPKGVVHRQGDWLYSCETYGRRVLGITADDVTFSSTKLFHAYGMGNGLAFPYWAGATTVLRSGRPTPDGVLDTIERFRPTLFFSAPTLYNAMLRSPGAEGRDLSFVRHCVAAAEALPPEVFRLWREAYGLTILDGIGSTEMLHIYCSNTLDDPRPGSSGRAVPGYDLEVRDDDGVPVPVGETGNLHARGGSMLAEYWNQPERNARVLRDGWFFTGDRYRVDADGFHWYEGRADDMMKVSGLWVSPIEIENVLLEHPAVAEAAVVGVDVDGLNRIKAFVTPAAAVEPAEEHRAELVAELQQWCKQRLQRYQFPQYVEFVDDLPKTATGKIQRFKLRGPS